MSDEELRRKMEICKEILKIFDVIEPGYTRIRGNYTGNQIEVQLSWFPVLLPDVGIDELIKA